MRNAIYRASSHKLQVNHDKLRTWNEYLRSGQKELLKQIVRLIALLMIISFAPKMVSAEDKKDFFDLSLLELMNVKVVAVSKKEEVMATAGGIISVLTSEDIKKLGAQTVAEAIGFMPGIMSYDSYITKLNQFAIRGNIEKGHYNSKILCTVNGHPYYSPIQGGFEVNAIPIDAIDRIELVRGPASVLYGTNALTGVINIVTKKEISNADFQASYRYGSFDTHEGRVSAGRSIGDLRYFISGSVKDQDGYDLVIKPEQDRSNIGSEQKQYHDFHSVFLNLEYKDLEVDFLGSGHKNPCKIGITDRTDSMNIREYDQEYHYLDIRYMNEIGDRVNLHALFRYDYIYTDMDRIDNFWEIDAAFYGWTGGPYDHANSMHRAEKVGGEVYANILFTKKLDMVAGLLYDKYYDIEYKIYNPGGLSGMSIDGDMGNYDNAIYGNVNYQLSDIVKIIGGLRYTENDVTGGHFDYCAGGVFQLKENLTLKTLYGTSYRSPNAFELNADAAPAIIGNEDLDFETLDGVNISLFYSAKNKLMATLTYYVNRTEDLIIRKFNPVAGSIQYTNGKEQEIQGVEYELKYFLLSNLDIFINGMHILDSEDKETDDELKLVENIVNFGWSWSLFQDSLRICNANMYHDQWDEADSFIISNFAVYYKPPLMKNNMEIFCTMNNAFDKEYEYSEFVKGNVDTIPGGPPRSITGGIQLKL